MISCSEVLDEFPVSKSSFSNSANSSICISHCIQSITLDPAPLQTLATPTRETGVEWVPMQQALGLPLFDETVPYRRAIVLLLKEKCERSRGFAVGLPWGCEGEHRKDANICWRGNIRVNLNMITWNNPHVYEPILGAFETIFLRVPVVHHTGFLAPNRAPHKQKHHLFQQHQ